MILEILDDLCGISCVNHLIPFGQEVIDPLQQEVAYLLLPSLPHYPERIEGSIPLSYPSYTIDRI